jgi:hypothetical protein
VVRCGRRRVRNYERSYRAHTGLRRASLSEADRQRVVIGDVIDGEEYDALDVIVHGLGRVRFAQLTIWSTGSRRDPSMR